MGLYLALCCKKHIKVLNPLAREQQIYKHFNLTDVFELITYYWNKKSNKLITILIKGIHKITCNNLSRSSFYLMPFNKMY